MVLVWFWCYFLTKKPFATQQSQHDIIPLRKRKIDGFVTCNSSPVGDAFWHVQYPFFQCYPIEIMLMFFLFWIRHNIHIYIYIYIYTYIIFLLIVQWVGSIGIFKFSAESRLEFSQRMEKSSIRKSLQDRKSGSFLFSSRSGKMKMTGNLRYLRVTNCKTAGIQPFSTGHSRTFHPAHMSRCGSASITKSQHQKVLGTGYPLFIT